MGSTLRTIWQNRRHFKLHIFGVTVLLVVAIFVANLITIKVSYDNKVANYMASTVKYTASTQMSLSGVSGTVDEIYVDSSKTRCFILMTLSDMSVLALNAGNYQAFVTNVTSEGVDNGLPEEQLSGEIYMFGASSRMVGIYLKSDIPFENTLKRLTFRSYSKYTSNTQPYYRSMVSDANYDQCHIYFNPGATGAKTIRFLEEHIDGEDFVPHDIYRQVTVVDSEKTIRQNILSFYSELQTLMNQIDEYRNRLYVNYDLSVPDLPQYAQGDYFDVINIYNDEGEIVDSYTRFMPATIFPGGTDYDWYVGSITTSYYDLVPDANGRSIRAYISDLNNQGSAQTTVKYEDWCYTDGTKFSLIDGNTTLYENEVLAVMDEYEDLINEYLKLKNTYQTNYLPSLLRLERDSEAFGQAYTVRNDENTVLAY